MATEPGVKTPWQSKLKKHGTHWNTKISAYSKHVNTCNASRNGSKIHGWISILLLRMALFWYFPRIFCSGHPKTTFAVSEALTFQDGYSPAQIKVENRRGRILEWHLSMVYLWLIVVFIGYKPTTIWEYDGDLIAGLEHWLYDFPFSWECMGIINHPNWRTPSFFRGVGQPASRNISKYHVGYVWTGGCKIFELGSPEHVSVRLFHALQDAPSGLVWIFWYPPKYSLNIWVSHHIPPYPIYPTIKWFQMVLYSPLKSV